MSDTNTAVLEAPVIVKKKGGRPPKIKPAPVAQVTPDQSNIIIPTASEVADMKLRKVGGSNVLEIGMEGITSTQTLGDFELPYGFDNVRYTAAYGCEEAGTVGAFRSVAELCQPQRHPAIRMVHPGWKVWTDANGKKHQIKKERGTLTLLYAERKDNDVINAAYGQLSKQQAKGTENKILRTNKDLPLEAQLQQAREEEIVRESIMQFEASQGGR
jgi:hypothetical protein